MRSEFSTFLEKHFDILDAFLDRNKFATWYLVVMFIITLLLVIVALAVLTVTSFLSGNWLVGILWILFFWIPLIAGLLTVE